MAFQDDIIQNTDGFGILDLGATETVGSLEAVEALAMKRQEMQCWDGDFIVNTGASFRKPFRFGNGGVKFSESFVLVPQRLGTVRVQLGIFTIDAERVPILIGMRTLTRLGAIIDVTGRWLVLSNVSPSVKIPLGKSQAGHLVVNLTTDWLSVGQPFNSVTGVAEDYLVKDMPELEINLEQDNPEHDGPFNPERNLTAYMVERDSSRTDEGECVFTLEGSVDRSSLARDSQHMRDRILQHLISDHHGSQEDQDQGGGAHGGALRLQSDSTGRSSRCPDNGTSLPWGTRGVTSGSRLQHGQQRLRDLDGVSQLWPEAELHPGLRSSRPFTTGWTLGAGHEGPGGGEEASQGVHRAAGQEGGTGRSREEPSDPPQDHPGPEGGVDEDQDLPGIWGAVSGGHAEGDHAELQEGWMPRGAGGQVIFGPSSAGIRFNAFPRVPGARDDEYSTWEQGAARGGHGRGEAVEGEAGGRVAARRPHLEVPGLHHGEDRRGDGAPVSLHYRTDALNSRDARGQAQPEPLAATGSHEGLALATEGMMPKPSGSSNQEFSFTMEPLTHPAEAVQESLQNPEPKRQKLAEEQAIFLLQEARDYEANLDELFAVLEGNSLPANFKVMELCCEENSGITKAVEARGGSGTRCGLFNGCDLSKRSGFNKVADLIKSERPDLMWVSLPCGPTSSIQELNRLTPESAAKNDLQVNRSKRLAGRAVTLMELQRHLGGHVMQEWPKSNRAWHFRRIREFWNSVEGCEAHVDGCSYGLHAPDEPEKLMKKPWRIRSTTKRVWQLHRLCKCREEHARCEGGQRTRASALYPEAMCKKIADLAKQIHEDLAHQVFAAELPPDYDPESLKGFTDQELMNVANELLLLHKKLGHPGRQVFVKMLRDRGASTMVKTIAGNLHCMDCEESGIPATRRAVTIEGATELWDTIQIDNMEFTVGDETFHFQIILDEASSYGAASFLFKHEAGKSRNATGNEVIQALHANWIQHFGYPKTIRLDKEGAHRSRALEEWCESHGVELVAIPAEWHQHLGKVERLIGTLKQKLLAHLRSADCGPEEATHAMMAAHNSCVNVGGYSPMQWVFGKNATMSQRLHDGPDLPYWSGVGADEHMRRSLERRLQAENHHRELTLQHKLNLARNTRLPPEVHYHPGDLVFYKRYQAPADRGERSHQLLDVSHPGHGDEDVLRWPSPSAAPCRLDCCFWQIKESSCPPTSLCHGA